MKPFWSRYPAHWRPRRPQWGLALRVTLGALLALAAAQALHLRLPLWAVLTAIIVTQLSVGRSVRIAFDYLVGTIGGAIYGGAITILVPHHSELALLGVLALAVAPLALLAAVKPNLNVATVTAIIVLLVPTMTPVAPLDSAIDRVLEVAVGSLSGLLVSFLVLPSRAQSQALAAAARALDLMAVALGELLAGLTRGLDNDALHRLQDGIGASLVTLNEIGDEAEHERATGLSSGPDIAPLIRTLLRLRHDLVMVGRAVAAPLPRALQDRLGPSLDAFRAAATLHLAASASALRDRGPPPPLRAVIAALDAYAAEVGTVRHDGLTRDLSGEQAERFFALGFAMEQLSQNFRDLEMRVTEWARPGAVVADTPPVS
ncbi:FUSC family protein [Rhodopseudomonas palustris]|uniref:FUSC family protein n=1 Tax=Rhodopseudomonas palustris TaxID=1076 RepID=UPI002ACD6792|nr:FUSC family protein [Rhodopseudomonas palustris]WQG99046.1 FUSC family protein [Rhodopseudomonas palustris]